MALRRALLVLVAVAACKGKGGAGDTSSIDTRCESLAKACADTDKHAEKMAIECKGAAKLQAEKGCSAQAVALYDCFQKELCGKSDKLWALEDFRVLAERQKKCAAETTALDVCAGK